MNTRWAILFLSCALLTGEGAAASDKANIVRDLAGRVGPILGSALACQDIARPRIQLIVDKFTAVIAEASTTAAERSDLTQLLDRNVANGRGAVTSGQTDCRQADRQLTDLERSQPPPPLPPTDPPPPPLPPIGQAHLLPPPPLPPRRQPHRSPSVPRSAA